MADDPDMTNNSWSSNRSLKLSVTSNSRRTCKLNWTRSMCSATLNSWLRSSFARFEDFISLHQWKVLMLIMVLCLFCFGLKATTVETNFETLWVEASDRLTAEWHYLASALQRSSSYALYAGNQHQHHLVRRSPLLHTAADDSEMSSFFSRHSVRLSLSGSRGTGLPGREFLGTTESIIQTSIEGMATTPESKQSTHSGEAVEWNLLTPQALLDHMEFLLKVRRLQVTVGSSKWSLKDLCQRASLPFRDERHFVQSYLEQLVPCLVVTPLDCFWEGAKVLGPEEAMVIPWFGGRLLLQWTNIDPVHLLEELQKHYSGDAAADVANLMHLFRRAGVDHGYLNRTCLDPTDPACPVSAPNYRSQPPDIGRMLTGGCPGFAGNILHWPEEVIVGGRVYQNRSINSTASFTHSSASSHNVAGPFLAGATALQSLIMLRSPWDLYEAVRLSDPFRHEPWTIEDANTVLDEWRRSLRRLIMEHNSGMPAESIWTFCAFTDTSLRDLLRDITLRLDPVKISGCLVLVCLYSVVCLLDWRDPVRSQCWLALTSLLVSSVVLVSGLGICAAIGLPFNVLTTQILPFLLVGLNVDGIFTLTTCHDCSIGRLSNNNCAADVIPSRSCHLLAHHTQSWSTSVSLANCTSATSTNEMATTSCLRCPPGEDAHTSDGGCRQGQCRLEPPRVLAEHAPSLLFGSLALVAAFFISAVFLLVPLVRQFCIQAGILMLVQSAALFLLLPVLIKLDSIRRVQRRLDVLCCLQHLYARPSRPRTELCLSESSNSGNCLHHPPQFERRQQQQQQRSGKCATGTVAAWQQSVPTIVTTTRSSDQPRMTVSVSTSLLIDRSCGGQHTYCKQQADAVQPGVVTTSLRYLPVSSLPSQWNRARRHSQAGFTNSQFTFSRPMLVHFARRFALMLTGHWLVMSIICTIGLAIYPLAGCILHFGHLKIGIDWSAVTPADSVEHRFIRASEQAFGMYTFQLVIQGTRAGAGEHSLAINGAGGDSGSLMRRMMVLRNGAGTSSSSPIGSVGTGSVGTGSGGTDLPMQQRQLHQLYNHITRLNGVHTGLIKIGDRQHAQKPRSWLGAMRDWLETVQQAFDQDRRLGYITDTGHWNVSASRLGVLGLWLLVQTDRGLELTRIKTGRLVHGGIIDPPNFYSLLRVWRAEDALNYSSLASVFHPEPTPCRIGRLTGTSGHMSHLPVVVPASPLDFIQTDFYAIGIGGVEQQLELVKSVRSLTESATAQGVPSFPTGVPFNLTENYLTLVRRTAVALCILFGFLFLFSLILFSSLLVATLVVVVGAGGGLCAALCGLYLLGLQLNPVSAWLLLLSSALGARLAGIFLANWPDWHTPFSPPLFDYLSVQRRSPVQLRRGCSSLCCPPKRCASPRDPKLLKVSRSRRQFTRVFVNQFTVVLHTTVGLILALALLAASRVRFLADCFFCLIAFVSLVCLFNTTCFLPTLCYLIQQLHEPPITPTQHHCRSHRARSIPVTRVAPGDCVDTVDAPSPPVDTVPTARCSCGQSAYCSCRSTLSSHRIASPPQPAGQLLSQVDDSLATTTATATSAAAAAAVAAAAVTGNSGGSTSSRSRPHSLSTISEEPSHSNSTVSLNHVPSGHPTETFTSQTSLFESNIVVNAGANSLSSVSRPGEMNLFPVSGDMSLLAVPESFRLDASTRALYQQLCGSILSQMQVPTIRRFSCNPNVAEFDEVVSPADAVALSDKSTPHPCSLHSRDQPPAYREVCSSVFTPKATHSSSLSHLHSPSIACTASSPSASGYASVSRRHRQREQHIALSSSLVMNTVSPCGFRQSGTSSCLFSSGTQDSNTSPCLVTSGREPIGPRRLIPLAHHSITTSSSGPSFCGPLIHHHCPSTVALTRLSGTGVQAAFSRSHSSPQMTCHHRDPNTPEECDRDSR